MTAPAAGPSSTRRDVAVAKRDPGFGSESRSALSLRRASQGDLGSRRAINGVCVAFALLTHTPTLSRGDLGSRKADRLYSPPKHP